MKNRQTIANMLLLALEKSIDGYVRFEDFCNNTHIYAKGYDRPLKKNSIAKAVARLRRGEFINIAHSENELVLKLTEKGQKLSKLQFILDQEWDGLYRIVVFDIPEQYQKVRRQLRIQLKEWEFHQLQKSVWVTKKNVLKELRDFTNSVKIDKWVKVFEAKLIDL